MTDLPPDKPAPPKKVYTPEEKAEILRRIRRGNIIMFLLISLIVILGVGMIYVQTGDAMITAAVAVIAVGYLAYREFKIRQK